jgi:hypothetical protein
MRETRIHFGPRLRVAKHQETQYTHQRVSDEYDNIGSSHNAPIFSRRADESVQNRLRLHQSYHVLNRPDVCASPSLHRRRDALSLWIENDPLPARPARMTPQPPRKQVECE